MFTSLLQYTLWHIHFIFRLESNQSSLAVLLENLIVRDYLYTNIGRNVMNCNQEVGG